MEEIQITTPVPQTDARTQAAQGRKLGFAAIFGAVLIWGPTYVATKIALVDMGPYLLAFMRFVLAIALLIPIAVNTLRKERNLKLPYGRLVLMGLTGGACYFAFQNLSLLYITAFEASLIGAMLPVVVAVVSWLVIGERLTPIQIGGIILAVAGVIFMTVLGNAALEASFSILGYLFLLGSAFSWAFFTILGRGVNATLPSTVVAAFNALFGAIFLLPLAIVDLAQSGWPQVSPLSWAMIAYLGLAGSGLSFLFWNYGLKTVSAGEAGTATNLGPFLGAYSAWAFLGEPITWAHIVGGIVVVAGVMLVTRQESHQNL